MAAEAAWTLGELAVEEPAAVLTASRRLVLRQPSCGPLWWACASILEAVGSDQVLEVAQRIALELAGDTVSARLAAAVRKELTAREVLALTPPVDTLARAFGQDERYELRLLAPYQELRYEMGHFSSADVTGYEIEEATEALEGARLLLVEPDFATTAQIFVGSSAVRAVRAAHRARVACWLVLGPGRFLSDTLAGAAAQLSAGQGEMLAPSSFEAGIDAAGLGSLEEVLARSSCPPAPELAHLSGYH